MILQISYQIRFPLGAEFQSDPKYLFIKKIYSNMKKIICVNSKLYKCENCIKKENCLYYFLSGEDFKGFPAIIVNRQLLEKKKYNKNESL